MVAARTDYGRLDANAPTPPGPGPYPAPPEAFPWSLKGEQQAFQARNINDPNGLYIVWSGSNDISDLIGPVAQGFLSFQQAVTQMQTVVVPGIKNVINTFLAAGAQDILVPNVPDLGKIPELLNYPLAVQQLATLLASTYNQLLNNMLDAFSDVNIDRVDVFSLMQQVAANPAMYGFTNVTTACYSGFVAPANPPNSVTVCSNPSEYAFWDIEHPTTAFHALLANRFYQAVVPASSSLMNFLLGLGVLAAVGRTRLLRLSPRLEK